MSDTAGHESTAKEVADNLKLLQLETVHGPGPGKVGYPCYGGYSILGKAPIPNDDGLAKALEVAEPEPISGETDCFDWSDDDYSILWQD